MTKRISSLKESEYDPNRLKKSKVMESPKVSFEKLFNEAMDGVPEDDRKLVDYNFNQKIEKSKSSLEQEELIAQGIDSNRMDEIFRDVRDVADAENEFVTEDEYDFLNTKRVEYTPFQLVIDKAIEVLESISQMDYRVNDLTDGYIQGKVSIDEVSIATAELNLAVSFATTLLSSVTTAFKEITQLAI